MSSEDKIAAKKRKRSSKAHDAAKPRKKRSKADIANKQNALTIADGDAPGELKRTNGTQEELKAPLVELEDWNISAPVGGRFLNASPVFSQDEKYLFLAAPSAIHIYECSNSLLVRELRLPEIEADIISAFALSTATPNHIFAGSRAGFLGLWDWTTGQLLGEWQTKSWICHIVPASENRSSKPLIYAHEILQEGGIPVIRLHELSEKTEQKTSANISSHMLLTLAARAKSFQVHLNGRVLAVALPSSLLIGERQLMEKRSLEDTRYVWRELHANNPISSFDIHVGSVVPTWNQNFNDREAPQFDIAIGLADGQIHIYEDIMNRLIFIENNSAKPEHWLPRQLHWHRRPVEAVRWGRDGNYIISGGQEMTLCLWQLGRNQRNTLPYLMAAILQIVVSPTGASYAIQLEDNSIMVLSTADLEAKTSIAGVQSFFLDRNEFEERSQSGHDDLSWKPLLQHLSTPALIDPLRPSQLLTAVSSSVVRSSVEPATPYVQRFDISTNRHVHRQAITRNNATHMNESPDGTLLREPDVTHMRISSDGRWMATVEHWTPPPNDLEHVDFELDTLIEGLASRREVYLKFWRRSADNHIWALDTRIESPHMGPDGSPVLVFALVTEPNGLGFATIGDDGHLKIWKPKTRLTDGRFVRGARGKRQGMVLWSARYSIFVGRAFESMDEEADTPSEIEPRSACIAYSSDGSVLAVSQVLPGGQSQGQIHLIDAASGQIQNTLTGLWQSGLGGLGFVDRYLVVASDSLCVWDLVDHKLEYALTLAKQIPTPRVRLAVNPHDKTFALALPPSTDNTTLDTRLLILRPSNPTPVLSADISNFVLALLPTQGSPGYVILDSAAEIRMVTPKSTAGIPLVSQIATAQEGLLYETAAEDGVESENEEDDEIDVDQEDLEANGVPGQIDDEMEDEENDRPIVRPEQLAEIFDSGPSFALPPVRNLFDAVVGLLAKKTKIQPPAETASIS